jgi:hypothetical protein
MDWKLCFINKTFISNFGVGGVILGNPPKKKRLSNSEIFLIPDPKSIDVNVIFLLEFLGLLYNFTSLLLTYFSRHH